MKKLININDVLKRYWWISHVIIVALVCLVYSNTINSDLIYDDRANVIVNPSIRPPLSLSKILAPPLGTAVVGRPLANITFAMNYMISGLSPWSYHVFNIIVHAFGAVFLFSVAKRIFSTSALRRFSAGAIPLGLTVALIWALHPIQTMAVSYVSQRLESMMALMFLMTLYFSIRGWEDSNKKSLWHAAAIVSCFAGVFVKEVIVTVPLIVFICDYLFYKENFKEVFRGSKLLYVGLILALITLGVLVSTGGTASTNAVNTSLNSWEYLLTQSQVVVHYIRLAFWPDPLVFYHIWDSVYHFADAWPTFIGLSFVLLLGIFGLFRRKPIAFPVLWFFVILAPTSSVLPLTFNLFEYRVYLPLAGIIGVVVPGVFFLLSWLNQRYSGGVNCFKVGVYVFLIVAFLLGSATFLRNEVYANRVSLWMDNVVKQPTNGDALGNLGAALNDAGRTNEALVFLAKAEKYIDKNELTRVYCNRSIAYIKIGKIEKAQEYIEKSLKIWPSNFTALNVQGYIYMAHGEKELAREYFEAALSIAPAYAQAQHNLEVLNKMD